jgi:hypothetical protein
VSWVTAITFTSTKHGCRWSEWGEGVGGNESFFFGPDEVKHDVIIPDNIFEPKRGVDDECNFRLTILRRAVREVWHD